MRRLLSITSTTLAMLGGFTAEAAELPAFEKFAFPMTPTQVSVLGAVDVRERSPIPTLTLGGMPASPHQIAVLTPRQRVVDEQVAGSLAPIHRDLR